MTTRQSKRTSTLRAKREREREQEEEERDRQEREQELKKKKKKQQKKKQTKKKKSGKEEPVSADDSTSSSSSSDGSDSDYIGTADLEVVKPSQRTLSLVCHLVVKKNSEGDFRLLVTTFEGRRHQFLKYGIPAEFILNTVEEAFYKDEIIGGDFPWIWALHLQHQPQRPRRADARYCSLPGAA